MISTRYHLMTVISIFFALGIGILLGGSLGQHWLSEQQQNLIDQLEHHYDEQLAHNRQLSANMKKVRQAYQEEKSKTDELLRLTLGDSLKNRYLVIFSADRDRAERMKRMIQWAGGQARTLNSLKYLSIDVDGIVLMGDGFMDQVNDDVLQDLQLLYRVPVVVQTTEPVREWAMRDIYTFNGAVSETLTEYRFLQFLGKVIPPFKEAEHDA